ncbi:MAG: biopolymer transporter ExbD [Chitinophagales bacterium]|nr:biopolymer transporter ExbD [Chitinophagales bacterium]
MSRFRRRHKEGAEVSTESLNDIMFFLMLFFLIVSTLVNPNVIRLSLPNSKSNSSLAKQPVILSVDKDKVIFVNKQQVNIEDLKSKLSSLVASMETPTIVLRLDQSLTVQDLVNIMQIGNELKIKMVLATQPAKQ